MADTVRTAAQLASLFADNFAGDISAQDGRDLIASAFGFEATTNPGVNNDRVDTAAVGAFFDRGSCWFNTSTDRIWFCFDGTPTAAVWRALMFDGETAGGDLSGTYPDPTVDAIAASGVTPGTFGDSTNVSAFAVNSEGRLTAAASTPIAFPAPAMGSATGTLAIAHGGTGQTTAAGAFDAQSPMTANGDLITRVGGTASRLAIGAANFVLVSNGTTFVWQALTINQLPTGSPIAGTIAEFPQWIKTTILYTDMVVAAQTATFTLAGLPAGGVIHGVKWWVTTVFAGSHGPPNLSVGYSSGGGATPTNTSRYINSQSVGIAQDVPAFSSFAFPETRNEAGSWNVTATFNLLGFNLNTLTAGAVNLWVLCSDSG